MRTNSPSHSDALRLAFAAHLVRDPAAPANFSLQFSGESDHAHVLYRGECPVLRTFDPERLVQALRSQIDSHVRSDELVPIEALAVVDPANRVTLLPVSAADGLQYAERPWRARGLRPVDSRRLLVDMARREVVLEPHLDVDEDAVRALVARLPPSRRQEPWPAYGRYAIRRWVAFNRLMHDPGRETRAGAVLRAWSALADPHTPRSAESLVQMIDLVNNVRFEAVPDPGRRLASVLAPIDEE